MPAKRSSARIPADYRTYGEVVMATPTTIGAPAHRPASRHLPTPTPSAPSGKALSLIRPACEPAPKPAETTATTAMTPADFRQLSAGWADHQFQARPCRRRNCFPTGKPR